MNRIKRPWWLVLCLGLGAVILALVYLTGPNVAVSYLFLVPVALAAHFHGRFWGIALGLVLPLIQFCFRFAWDNPLSVTDSLLNAAIRIFILVGAAVLIDRVTRQAREIRMLQGILPVCMFCKKIRTPQQQWQPMETYISEHSGARFSHTFCPECGKEHYNFPPGDAASPSKPTASAISSR